MTADGRPGRTGKGAALPAVCMMFRAMAVHWFTALGACAGLLAMERAFARDFPAMFGWLALAFLIDGVDGTLARRARVKEHAPHIDGDLLDAVVDYLTYVATPLAAIWQGGLMPAGLAIPAVAFAAAGSAVYFADKRMKTADYWFRGFPALWNVVALYLFVFPMPAAGVFAVLVALTLAMFSPVVFVHPMRVVRLRLVTQAVMAAWFGAAALLVWNGFAGPSAARIVLALGAVYFLALPLFRGAPLADDPPGGRT